MPYNAMGDRTVLLSAMLHQQDIMSLETEGVLQQSICGKLQM